MALKALLLKIDGRVQGVSYRAAMKDAADAAGVKGWVMNVSGGSVEAFIEGEEAAVEEVLSWAKRGPPAARVEAVAVEDSVPRGLTSFEVER